MRAWLEAVVQRLFPGMGLRPLYLTALATWAMVIYYHHGGGPDAPEWFLRASEDFFDLPIQEFHRHLWAHVSAVVVLMIVPLMICFGLEGWTPRDLGFRIRGTGTEVMIVLGLWAAMIPIVWLVHDTEAFARIYPRLPQAKSSAEIYFLYEGLYLVKWIAWEFFFRGFMLFGFGKDLLHRSVLISTIPFTLMHFGKPELEMASALIAGFVLCFIALRSRSIWPGVLLHWLVASTMDFFAADFWR